MDKKQIKYINPPKVCDVCKMPFGDVMYDANTVYGWANMCESCFNEMGIGLGVGLGQMYKLKDGEWIKERG